MGCQETCQAVHFSCKNIFIMTGKGQLPDCSKASPLTGLPLDDESACNVIKSTVPNSAPPFYNLSSIPPGFIMDGCPSPFIKDPLLLNHSQTISPFCHSGCCIPCPAQNFVSFFRETNGYRKNIF
jgi:hypothetical protein